MKPIRFLILLCSLLLLLLPALAVAGDDYVCDTAIYGGSTAAMQPNVLFILDTSGSMADSVMPKQDYDSAIDYPALVGASNACGGQPCVVDTVYKCTAFGLECGNWTAHVTNLADVTTSCGRSNPYRSLSTYGQWNGSRSRLATDGSCTKGKGIYATGNWISWRDQMLTQNLTTATKMEEAQKALAGILDATDGLNFGLMTFDDNGSAGGQFLTSTYATRNYTTTVKPMEDIHYSTYTNKDALTNIINNTVADGWTPLAETLYEANRYFAGEESAFGNGTYTSPILGSCQQNYVILITDGMSTQDQDGVLDDICEDGDCDGDGFEPSGDPDKNYDNSGSDYLDDVAKYMYDRDFAPFVGKQNVKTYTIGFGLAGANAGAVKLIEETAENGIYGGNFDHNGDGVGDLDATQESYFANDAADLVVVLSQIFGKIFEVDTSFVAPVVPTSPENKTYSGNRIYLGFFKPQTGMDWQGNLKKFGLDSHSNVVDKNGQPATDSEGAVLDTSVSFWNNIQDAGRVDAGGVGDRLRQRSDLDPAGTTPRKIYTYMGTNSDLTDSSNRFDLSITPATIGLDPADTARRDQIVKYLYGLDAFDDNANGSATDNRDWVLGDILHSKPAIVNFNSYTPDNDLVDGSNSHDENNCPSNWANDFSGVNKTMIFVGSNDGQLHAFSDCNGEELWSFIPDNVLPDIGKLHDATHNYYIDSSPTVLRYDKSRDGDIGRGPTGDDGSSDLVILIFGQRRGGGQADNSVPAASWGYYYAIDVTIPDQPKFLWKLDRTSDFDGDGTPEFAELAETWSQPNLGKVKVDNGSGTYVDKIVAFVGAGYDNLNEDGRFGDNQNYTNADVGIPTSDEGDVDSAGAVVPASVTNNPKGRGVFAFEVATLDGNGVPTIASTPNLVWEFTPDTTNSLNSFDTTARGALDYSVPADIAAIDKNFDGYTDHLYFGDTGGQLWRVAAHDNSNLPISDNRIENWYGNVIFSANPGNEATPTSGRKIFYRPSVVLESSYTYIFFGTGDRPHPLNKGTMDRIYAVKDKKQLHKTVTEVNLEDVTLNKLQDPSTPLEAAAADGTCTANEVAIECINERLKEKYGWLISLNVNPGEKVMAPVLAFNGVLYATSFTTEAVVADPCRPGNLGTGRLYAVNYSDGTAAKNLYSSNDSGDDPVLEREDREKVIGVGIPSGVIVVLPKDGDAHIIAGAGGGIMQNEATPGGLVQGLYWREK